MAAPMEEIFKDLYSRIVSLHTDRQHEDYFKLVDATLTDMIRSLSQHDKGFRIDGQLLEVINCVLSSTSHLTDQSHSAEVTSCQTNCFRLCRNLVARETENQTILRETTLIENVCRCVNNVLTKNSCTEDVLVLLRCAVQFLGNYCSGNSTNQMHVWQQCSSLFKHLLAMDDMKLREYTMMVVHLILSGNQFGKARVDTAASELIIGCLSVATQTESENGLLVVEDILMLVDCFQQIFSKIPDAEKLLTLEICINSLKRLPEDETVTEACDMGVKYSVPDVSNVQYIAADFVSQCHHIPNLASTNGENESKMLCIVKELECLGLASSHHRHYNILQENDQLLRTSIHLLQNLEEIGHQGQNVFSNIDKVTRQAEVNTDHPVFGLKRDLIRLIGNLVYQNTANQDLVRELDGIPLILNKTTIDANNPFISQWSIFAAHNLTEGNEKNISYIAALKMEGIANNQALLDELGISAEVQGDKVFVKKQRTE